MNLKMSSILASKVAVAAFGTDKNQIIINEKVAAFNSWTSLLFLTESRFVSSMAFTLWWLEWMLNSSFE